ncbi:MAG: FKBP-type peptidyl-prolyl cis-trans isomerase [Muribaculaceae bacterium]|nr:FKBP-type peptidyl-prolyl cis-trans isomerase [Muribaculaceae bacterium]
MKFSYLLPAVCAGVLLTACSSQEKKGHDSVADTANLVVEQVEEATQTNNLSTMPYDAEFFANEANQGAPGDSAKWTATPSGLKYTVISMGKGAKPAGPEAVVEVHYAGQLTDGTPFDSSYDRGTPTTFPLGGVIKGWTEGLQLMPVGSVYEFYIPSDLAYGERGAGEVIPPNAPLLFKVELLSIQ